MHKTIKLLILFFLITNNIIYAKESERIDSVASLNHFINNAIKKGVIPKKLAIRNHFWNAKFEDIEFNFRTLIQWQIDSQCYAHHDFIIDATKGKNHSIECNSGDTIVVAGDGDDWIHDASGNDIIYAGKGHDTIDAGGGSDILIFEKGWGNDTVTMSGFEVIPEEIIGNDGTYNWKYSSFIVFGKGIHPDDLEWQQDVLTHKITGDSITFTGDRNFNIVFMDTPIKPSNAKPKKILEQIIKPIVLAEQKVESLEVNNHILYLSNGHLGIDIVDVENIKYPLCVSHIDLPGRALKSKRYGNLLFVAQSDIDMTDKKGWLSIIDVSNPAQPKLLSSLKYGGRIYDFLLENGKLIIDESNRIDKKSVFHILDISNPKKPKELASTLLKTHVQSIALVNNWLWAASVYGCGVYGYDLNNLKKLKYSGYFSIDKKWIYQIQKDKNIAAVYVGSCEPVIALFADGNHLEKGLVSSILKKEKMQENNSFLIKDNVLFVAEGKNGINIYDLIDISKPILKQNINFDGLYIKNFAIANDRIYGVDSNGGIHVKEVMDLSQDQLLTVLYKAIEEDDDYKVNKLINQGVQFKIKGHKRNSPLESAAKLGNNKALKVLLDRGADPNSNYGQAIILAALNEKDSTLRLLSQYGGDMKIKDKDDGCTALHYIAQDGEVETAKFLISKGADPHAMCRGRETPLTWATFGKNQPMIDFLNSLQK